MPPKSAKERYLESGDALEALEGKNRSSAASIVAWADLRCGRIDLSDNLVSGRPAICIYFQPAANRRANTIITPESLTWSFM
jgi:hypothetical protein